MNEQQLLGKKILKLTGITAAVYVSVRFLLPLVIPFLIAFGLAACLNCLVKKLTQAKRTRKKVACFVVFFVFLLLFFGIGAFLLYQLFLQMKGCLANYKGWCDVLSGYWCQCCDRMEAITGIHGGKINEIVEQKIVVFWKEKQDGLLSGLVNHSMSSMRRIFGILWIMLVTFVSTLLLLLDFDHITSGFGNSGIGKIVCQIAGHVKHAGGSYLKAQFIIWGLVSTICVVGLFLAKNPYALLAGIVIGICDAMPFLGTGTVFIPWMILEVIQGKYGYALWYLFLYLACVIVREMAEPRLVGNSIGVHPICVLMSIYIGIKVYGGVGVIFGPLSAFLIWEIYNLTQNTHGFNHEMGEKNDRNPKGGTGQE